MAYANALIAVGAKETGAVAEAAAVVAKIVWTAALRREAWAVHELIEAVGGQRALRIEVERAQDDEPDYTRLSDAEFEELGRLLDKAAGGGARLLESGNLPALPEGLHPDGLADR